MFPQTPPNARAARLTTFQVLVEDELGCLSFLETKARTPPEPASTLAVLAAHGWSARRPWQPPSRGAGAPLLQMHADVEAPASWPLEASVRDALGAALAVRMPAQASDAAALRDTLRMDMSTGLALAVEEFVGRLDAGIVRLARAAGGLSVARYNYLAGGDPLTRRNRLQAVGRHPALLDSLAADPGYESVRNAIDAGEPLLDRLSLHFGVPKSVVRRVADTPLAWIDARWRARPHLLMRLLADIEPSNRPANQEQWGRFDRAVELVTRATGHPATSTGNRLWIRRSASEGFRRTPAPDANLAGIAAVLDAFCAGVQEALREDLRDLAGAAQADLLARHALARLQQGLGVERLASLAAKWLAAWRVEQAGAEAELRLAAGERWPSLLPDGLQTDALRVVALCTPGALREEAARMGHCVDTYVGACARGECQIFSIRSEGDLPLSTIETKVARTPGGVFSVAIVQHAGALNATPPARCIRVAGALVDVLSRAKAELEAYWRWRTSVARLLRGDRIAVARAAAARRALERVLPKRLGYDVLLQAAIARASPPGGAGGSPA